MNPEKRHPFLCVFLLLAGIFFLSISGLQSSPDEEEFYRITERFLADRTLGSEQMKTVPEGYFLIQGKDGKPYSIFGPGLLPFHLPLVFFGKLLPEGFLTNLLTIRDFPFAEPRYSRFGPRWAFALSGPLFTLLLCFFVHRLGLLWGLSNRETLLAIFLTALATPVWAYGKTTFRDVPHAAFLLGGIVEAIFAVRSKARGKAVLSGILFGFAFLAKEQAEIHVAIGLLWVIRGLGGIGGFGFTGGFLFSAFPLLFFKWSVLGSLWQPLGGGFSDLLTTPLHIGLLGLLFSPGKGLFLFAPVLLFALPGAKELSRKEHPEELLFILLNLLFLLIIPAIFRFWHGGLCWGPRLILPVVPWLGTAAVLALRASSGRFLRLAFGGAFLVGVFVNLGGLALDWHLFHALQEFRYQMIGTGEEHSFFDSIAFTPQDSMILAGWRTLGLLAPSLPPEDVRNTVLEKAWPALNHSKQNLFLRAWVQQGNGYVWLGIPAVVAILTGFFALLQVVWGGPVLPQTDY
jgi:hypothetical protein